ncbi:hypothetical protein GCM10009843_23660 [Nocardioides bigeumensis]|uniref:Glycosyltransferase family 2 protein n=1 Tax=Nocardioides bigeumensis TaxID=433657 RepID=A0ABN2YDV3_9ACTN
MVLVSHSGADWLPTVLDGIAAQTRWADRIVAVDTGSRDISPELLTRALGADHVTTSGRQTSYGEAVDLGLALLDEVDPSRTEWVWLLHDDSTPSPTALEELLAAAAGDPTASVLGPKLREWPSLRRLLEVGVTISGTGRRETGLERSEYDQGQHDAVRQVLAVNTAGMLVRRDVLDALGGFDRQLPIFGNDVDFGWRAAEAGYRTLVVPQAVVFHAEAAHTGSRRTSLTGRHTHYQERRAALWTLLVNGRGRTLPWRVVRLAVGTIIRMVGFLLVRSVGEALDELAALLSVYSRPRQLLAARRARRRAGGASRDTEAARALLSPWWVPYRHGLDFVSDLAAALSNQAADVAERRRAAALEREAAEAAAGPKRSAARTHQQQPHERRAGEDDDDLLEPDSGLLTRFLTSPVAVGVAVFVGVVLAGTRQAWGAVSGGGLAPAPGSASDWWRLYVESSHALALGTSVPAPPVLVPLAMLASLLGGSAVAAVSVVMVLAMPVALWGAWRLVRAVGSFLDPAGMPRWLVAAGAATYALVPAVSGAWGDGRLGQVLLVAVLPWLAHAALAFADPEADRRWRAAWRTGLLLALATACTPMVFPVLVVMVLGVLALAARLAPDLVADRSVSLPPLVALGVVPVLLVPWWLPLLVQGHPGGLLLEPGRFPAASTGGLDLLLGRLEGLGAPVWLAVPIVLAALLALVPARSRVTALVCWTTALVTTLVAALVAAPTVDVLGGSARPGAGGAVPVVTGALVVAGCAGALAVLQHLRAADSAWQRRLAAVPAVVALAVPTAGAVWFAAGGHDNLTADEPADVPTYMSQSSLLGPEHGILVVRGDIETGLRYAVRRGDGDTLGDDEVLALTAEDRAFSNLLTDLVARPTPEAVDELAASGIEYIVLPAPADGRISARLDASAGLAQASAEDRSTRAWRVGVDLPGDAVGASRSWSRILLLIVQGLAVLVVAVLAGPSIRAERRTRR